MINYIFAKYETKGSESDIDVNDHTEIVTFRYRWSRES